VLQRANGCLLSITIGVSYWFHREVQLVAISPVRKLIFKEDSSMTKTATFTVMHFSVAFTVVYLMTGDFMVGGAVALVEPLINSLGYFVHERVWDRLRRARGPHFAV
jgi:uncharacterized membrane protein